MLPLQCCTKLIHGRHCFTCNSSAPSESLLIFLFRTNKAGKLNSHGIGTIKLRDIKWGTGGDNFPLTDCKKSTTLNNCLSWWSGDHETSFLSRSPSLSKGKGVQAVHRGKSTPGILHASEDINAHAKCDSYNNWLHPLKSNLQHKYSHFTQNNLVFHQITH